MTILHGEEHGAAPNQHDFLESWLAKQESWACCHFKSTLIDTEEPQIGNVFFYSARIGGDNFLKGDSGGQVKEG